MIFYLYLFIFFLLTSSGEGGEHRYAYIVMNRRMSKLVSELYYYCYCYSLFIFRHFFTALLSPLLTFSFY